MFRHWQNYYWKNGKPYGLQEKDPALTPSSYKIVADPYFKRISIEKYRFTHLDYIVYDSYLLDFRHLTLKDQIAWQREILKEENHSTICLLRNEDDRAIFYETLHFEKNICRSCTTSSIHGIPLSIHRMFYTHMEDPFNGVVLYDNEKKPVMHKIYNFDTMTNEFTNLLLEEWNMQKSSSYEADK